MAALIEAGANVNASAGPGGSTPMYAAAWEGTLAAIAILLFGPRLTRC